MTYEEATELLAKRPHLKRRKLARNTYLRRIADNALAISLHDTDIVIMYDDGHYTLYSGGFRTMVTMERLNRFTPAGVIAHQNVWYLRPPGSNTWNPKECDTYYDGIIVNERGARVSPKSNKDVIFERKLKKDIDRMVAKLRTHGVPVPEAGDCFICQFSGDGSCVPSHLKECYLHGSLMIHALKHARHQDSQLPLIYHICDRKYFVRPLRTYLRHTMHQLRAKGQL